MATAALRDLQKALLPAAVGSIAMVYSNIVNMGVMGKIRYADKSKEVHPYKPWDDKSASAERHFRAFKGCQNGVEWTVYGLPVLWLYVIYTPAIPHVGKLLPWTGAVLACAFAYFNTLYVEGYAESADDRIPPFRRRTMAIRGLLYGTAVGILATLATTSGFAKFVTPKACLECAK
jgi:predicted outer membrane lipoprotein